MQHHCVIVCSNSEGAGSNVCSVGSLDYWMRATAPIVKSYEEGYEQVGDNIGPLYTGSDNELIINIMKCVNLPLSDQGNNLLMSLTVLVQ